MRNLYQQINNIQVGNHQVIKLEKGKGTAVMEQAVLEKV